MRSSPARWASRAKAGRPPSPETQAQLWLARPIPGSAHDTKRRDIINPDLCHEAVHLIQSTAGLPPPGTCDVIDFNPGTCVWSRALHQALQPRRHVLVELEKTAYASAIDPLLRQKASTYRHTSSVLRAFDLDQDLLSPEFRSYHKGLDLADQANVRRSRNKQLILTANLAGRNVTSGGYAGPVSKLFVDAFQRSIAADVGSVEFHKYGLVKLLAWIPEKDKYSIVPRCTSFRYRTSKTLEASCHIREIVSSFHNDGRNNAHSAWHGAVLENIHEVAEKQRKAGINIPEHRTQPDPQPPSIFYPPVPENFKPLLALRQRPPLVAQFIKLYEKIQKEFPHWLAEYLEIGRIPPDTPHRHYKKSVPDDEEYDRKQLTQLRIRMLTTHNNYVKVDELARRIVAPERELIALRRQYPDDKRPYLDRLNTILESDAYKEVKTRISLLFKDNRHHLGKALDDYRALSVNPHVLAWNNREFEPLLCHPKTDFFPHRPMTLVEITPKEEFVARINTSLRWICFEYIIHQLDLGINQTVRQALEKLVGPSDSEAYKDFVAKVPTLTDPLYGGHHDLSEIRARTLPTDTVIDITLAYENMPFRKDEEQMITVTHGRHNS